MLPSDAKKCSVSGLTVDSGILIKSHISNRLLLPEHSFTCSVTGVVVCPDEVEKCSLSGAMAVPKEIGVCELSGMKVLKKLLFRCVDTGKNVIRSEIGYSDYKSRPVLKKLLKKSQRSPGRLGTNNEFGKCQKTGKVLLLDELTTCELTNLHVDSNLIVTCGETGKKVLVSETTVCVWQNLPVINRYVGTCELIRLPVANRFLDQNGMLRPLAQILDNKNVHGAFNGDSFLTIIKRVDDKFFTGAFNIKAIRSPGKDDRFVICLSKEKKGWFSNKVIYIGFLLDIKLKETIIGSLVVGIRNDANEWELQDRFIFS